MFTWHCFCPFFFFCLDTASELFNPYLLTCPFTLCPFYATHFPASVFFIRGRELLLLWPAVKNCYSFTNVLLFVLLQVFLSIKGIYYQAEVLGQTITWLVPYQFAHDVSCLTSNRPSVATSCVLFLFLLYTALSVLCSGYAVCCIRTGNCTVRFDLFI